MADPRVRVQLCGRVCVEIGGERRESLLPGPQGRRLFAYLTLHRLGGELQFWKVAIKPGRPFVFGQYRGKLFFGLPGNPVSAFVTFLLLVRPGGLFGRVAVRRV